MHLCEVCHKKKATVHYTEIIKNKMVKINLCENCAKEKGVDIYSKFSIADLLSGLSDIEETKSLVENRKCAHCEMSYQQFREVGRFGCSKCYLTFEEMLVPLLEVIHKHSKHVGKAPKRWSEKAVTEVEVKTLEEALQKAIAKEEFEDAAKLRDQIRHLKEAKRRKK
jgi:protein arginine kinase activator